MWEMIAIGTALSILLLLFVVIVCRIWKRNRYYKKVQHSLDEEERAFQECAYAAAVKNTACAKPS